MKKILYAKPSITELEIKYVNDAIRNGWGEHCYDYVIQFQEMFKKYLNVKYAIPTSSCTGALHIALFSLGIGSGDEVIVPDSTWIQSVAPILYLNAKPIFIDVLRDTWCIDPKRIEEAITSKTKAIIPVHLYGNLVEMDEVLTIAKKNDLYVIEDAAEALGSEYKGRKAGSIGDFGVFSFHGTKTLTTGEGGMVVCNDDIYFEQLEIIADQGRDPKVPKTFWCEQIGLKYKLSNIQAALGCAQLKRIKELLHKKREIFDLYRKAFSNFEDIQFNPEQNYVKNSFWMPTIIFGNSYNFDRDELLDYLNNLGIAARPFFYPVSLLPMFEEKRENSVSYDIYPRGINLPSNFEINKKETEFISQKIYEFLKG